MSINLVQLGGNTIDKSSGNKSISTQRICIATDDIPIQNMSYLLYDWRLLGASFYKTGFRKVSAKGVQSLWIGDGTGSPCQQGNVSSQTSAAKWGVEPIYINPTENTYLQLVIWNLSSINISLPWDGCTIQCISVNDATAGNHAQQINLQYYDDTNTLQNVTHSLSNTATTYNIREIINLECVTFGATKQNQGTIYITNPGFTSYVSYIHGGANIWYPNHIIVPYNGYVLLDKLNVVSAGNMWIRIFLVKQTGNLSSNITMKMLWHGYQTGTSFMHDLSHLNVINGPTVLTENWAIYVGCLGFNASVGGQWELIGKQYRP